MKPKQTHWGIRGTCHKGVVSELKFRAVKTPAALERLGEDALGFG